MTRVQAHLAAEKVVQGRISSCRDPLFTSDIVQVIEALGLIQFDQTDLDEGRRLVQSMADAWMGSAGHGREYLGKAIIKDIEDAGFKIVRA